MSQPYKQKESISPQQEDLAVLKTKVAHLIEALGYLVDFVNSASQTDARLIKAKQHLQRLTL